MSIYNTLSSFFGKTAEPNYTDLLIKQIATELQAYILISTALNVHLSRLAEKAVEEIAFINAVTKIPLIGNVFYFGNKPTASTQYQTTKSLLETVKPIVKLFYDINQSPSHAKEELLREAIAKFSRHWEKQKSILKPACELDMPFSDAAKQGTQLFDRIDKMLNRVQAIRAATIPEPETASEPSSPEEGTSPSSCMRK